MKICFVSREFPGVEGGGIGTYVAEAGRALGAAGHECWLVTPQRDPDKLALLRAAPGFAGVLPTADASGPEAPFEHVAAIEEHTLRVHQVLSRSAHRFDYIEFPDFGAEGLVCMREQRLFGSYGNTVLGVVLHSPKLECEVDDGQSHRITAESRAQFALEDETIRSAPKLWAPSAGMRDRVCARLGIDATRVPLIRYPMTFAGGPPAPALAPRSPGGGLRFLYFGRIEPRKGVTELVQAFARIPEHELTLIGGDTPFSPYGGSLRAHLQARAPRNVRFEDAVPRSALAERMQQADVCIFPSRFENWPNTCIEAMAQARVVVGGRHGGMSEMVEHGVSGFLVDGNDPEDIVRVIKDQVVASTGRFDAIGRAAAARIRALSDPQRYVDALLAHIGSSRPSPRARPQRTPLVSVVMPFFDDVGTVEQAARSALVQEHRALELVIVDDGSRLPESQQLLERIRKSDERVRVLHQQNGGLAAARNLGLDHVRGEFVVMLDADNVLRPDYLRCAVEAFAAAPEAMFCVPQMLLFHEVSRAPLRVYNPLPFDRGLALLKNWFGDAGAAFRREVFTDHGLRYDALCKCYEDWALWMDIAARGLRGAILPRVLYDYRVRVDSMMLRDGWPDHVAIVGLLIERHLPQASDLEQQLLVTLNQQWGAAGVAMLRGKALRYVAADKIAGAAARVPGLKPVLREVARRLVAFANWRRGRTGKDRPPTPG